jgi:hypothetical protein
MAMRRKKFVKGAPIRTLAHLEDELALDHWVYWRDKPRHPSIIMNMPYRVVKNAGLAGILWEADPIKEEKGHGPKSDMRYACPRQM